MQKARRRFDATPDRIARFLQPKKAKLVCCNSAFTQY
jgi:hypothetical protein